MRAEIPDHSFARLINQRASMRAITLDGGSPGETILVTTGAKLSWQSAPRVCHCVISMSGLSGPAALAIASRQTARAEGLIWPTSAKMFLTTPGILRRVSSYTTGNHGAAERAVAAQEQEETEEHPV